MILRAHHAQISIPFGAEVEARKFYCNCLGLSEIERPEILKTRTGFWLGLGDFQIHFSSEEGFDRNLTKAHLAYEVNDLKAARAQIKAYGLTIKESTPIPDYDRFEFRDPFGNRVEFLQRKSGNLKS